MDIYSEWISIMNYKRNVCRHYIPIYMFRLNHIGLTYSNVDQQAITLGLAPLRHDQFKDELKNHLFNLWTLRPSRIMVAKELHQDGNVHYHCYVHWLNGGRRVPQDFFDYKGIHPNIQQLRNANAWMQYITKDDDFIDWLQVIDLESDDGYETE